MTDKQKLEMLKGMLGIADSSQDEVLKTYLQAAQSEIIAWRYSYEEGWEDTYDEVPAEYEMTQISAVVAGFTIRGAEGQTAHRENEITRTFKYEDMVSYIRSHVIPKVGLI